MTDLPPGWSVAPLGELLTELQNGVFVSRPGIEDTGRPILRISAVRPMMLRQGDVRYVAKTAVVANEENRYIAKGDLLFTRYSGSPEYVGACARVRDHVPNTLYPDKLIRGRVIPGLADPGYIEAAFSAPQTRAIVRSLVKTTAGQVGISGADLRSIPVPLAPYREQRRIVAAIEEQFSRLDAAEKLLHRTQLSLTRLGYALAKESIEVNFPSKPLQEICESLTDGDHQPPPQVPEGIPFLVIGNVRTGHVNFTGCRYVPLSYYQGLESKRRPRRGDVLYTVVGSYGIPVLVADDREFCVQRHIAILRPKSDIDAAYLMQVLRTPSVRHQADACATGTAQKTVPLSGLRNIRVPVPSLGDQRRISAILQEWDTHVSRLSSEIQRQQQRSANLRASILEAAFFGKLT